MHKVGAIDLGSNSLRLLVAAAGEGKTVPLRRELIESRLSEGLQEYGRLYPPAKKRTVEALGALLKVMREEEVYKGVVVATGAARDAADGAEFLKAAQGVSPYPVRLLSAAGEARLSYRGAAAALRSLDSGCCRPGVNCGNYFEPHMREGEVGNNCLVLDLGGRSTELSWQEKGRFYYRSFAFGAVSLHERYYARQTPPLVQQRRELCQYLKGELSRQLGGAAFASGKKLVGVGGTITTLAALERGLVRYEPEAVHRFCISDAVLEKWEHFFVHSSEDERASRLCFAPRRADIIAAGTTAALSVVRFLQKQSIVVSEEGLLWGVIMDLLEQQGNGRPG